MADVDTPLQPPQIADLLRASAAAIRAEWIALPSSLLSWHPAPGEWCIKETLGHVIEAERRGFAGRIRTMRDEEEPLLPQWDQRAVAQDRRDCERHPADLIGEFLALRQESAGLVSHLQEGDLARGGRHPVVGYLLIGEILQEWVHHDHNHFRQMLANVQAYIWPWMGSAQRFTELEVAGDPSSLPAPE